MVVCLARPSLLERRPSWGAGQDFHQRVTLEPLSKRESRDLVREILKKVTEGSEGVAKYHCRTE